MQIYSTLSDHELFDLLKKGDKDAYTEIYQRYFRLLYVHAYKKLQDEEEAKDIIQELFTMLWMKREDILIKSNLIGFLYTVTRNRVLDYFAHKDVQSKYVNSLQGYIDQESLKTDHPIREKEFMKFIEQEIQALPPKMRTVFELSRNENRSHKEIAEQLNISEQTVSKQITNALKILRNKLGVPIFIILLLNL